MDDCHPIRPVNIARDGSPVHPGSGLSRAGHGAIDIDGEEDPKVVCSWIVAASIVAPRERDAWELPRGIAPMVVT